MYYWLWHNWNNIDIPSEKNDGESESDFEKRKNDAIEESRNTAFSYYTEKLNLTFQDPTIQEENPFWKEYLTHSELRINAVLGNQINLNIKWEKINDYDKEHIRNAICLLVNYWFYKGIFNSKGSTSGSVAGINLNINQPYENYQLPEIVLNELENVSFYSSATFSSFGIQKVVSDEGNKKSPTSNLFLTKIEAMEKQLKELKNEINATDQEISSNTTEIEKLKNSGSNLTMKNVTDKIEEEINKQSNHPITTAQRQQLFTDVTTINTNLSKKADTATLNALRSSLFFQDGLNRQLFLDAAKEFFFQRNAAKGSELDFFYKSIDQHNKTVFFQIKLNPKEIWFDQQTNFNLMPKFRGQPLGGGITSQQLNDELEHVYHLLGWHSLFNQHFNEAEINSDTWKTEQQIWASYQNGTKSVNIRALNSNDWLHEEGDYSIEYFFELEKSSREINLNTITLGSEHGNFTNWKYSWFYLGMSTWGNWANASGNQIGVGWLKFDQETTFKLKLKITLSKNSDGTRNYLFILTAQNQKSDNFVKFRAKSYLANQGIANYIKILVVQMNRGNSNNQFSKPKHLNIKVLEQIHH